MRAAELIEQIKALPPNELQAVRDFVLNEQATNPGRSVRYIPPDEARELGAKIMDEHAELFRRLAQ